MSHRILVIDDDAASRDFMATLLGYHGYRVSTAADGEEGLEALRAAVPDLVICDILMPTMDGFGFVRRLREVPGMQALPVLFWTAHYHEREAIALARQCAVSAVMTKPIEPQPVVDLVARTLQRPPAPGAMLDGTRFERDHLQLVTGKLHATQHELSLINAQLSALIDVNLQLASQKDLAELVRQVARSARKLCGARHGFLVMRARGEGAAALWATAGLDAEAEAGIDAAAAIALADRVPAEVHRVESGADDRLLPGFPPGFPAFSCALVVPVRSPYRDWGWLGLVDKIGADGFSEADARLAGMLGAQAGRIYENGSLNSELSERSRTLEMEVEHRIRVQRRLEVQCRIAEVLAGTERFEDTGQQVLECLGSMLDYAAGTLWEVDPGFATLNCVATSAGGLHDPAGFLAANRALRLRRGEGIAGRAWETAAPVWSPDVALDPAFEGDAVVREAGLRTGLAVPILIRGVVTGVLDLFATEVRPPSPRLQETLAAVANQMSQFMQRRAQYRQMQRMARLHAMVAEVNAAIVRGQPGGQLLQYVCDLAHAHGRFAMAWAGIVDEDGDGLRAVAAAGVPIRDLPAVDLRTGVGVISRAMRSAAPAFSNDLLTEPEALQDIDDAVLPRDLRSAIALPIVVDGEVQACLVLASRERDLFSGDEKSLLSALAGDLAFALRHERTVDALSHQAHHDALTGLLNRSGFLERLETLLHAAGNAGNHIGLVLGDVRRFRQINDSLGRDIGDTLLSALAARLSEYCPEAAAIGRVGGARFCIALPMGGSATELAILIEERAERCFRYRCRIDGGEIAVEMALGLALFPDDGGDAASLLANAEAAMRSAKDAGELLVFYEQKMNARVREDLLLESALRRALVQDEFELHYQPKVSLADGSLRGCEALLRWRDPASGLVPPAAFIPLLEETGLILDVGYWALCRALRDARAWRPAGTEPSRVAVNVSALQLRQRDFVEVVRGALEDAGGEGVALELEITESLAMSDIEDTIEKFSALQRLGVRVVIDDFGTGYSSLAYLARLPLDALKIDRSFVANMTEQAQSRLIVGTTISLAHSLQLGVVAEGVETEEQATALRELGCDQMQGFLLSRALPAAEYAAFVSTRGS